MCITYAIPVTNQHIDLIVFLNEGVRPPRTEEYNYFVAVVNGPREITSTFMTASEVSDKFDVLTDPTFIILK